MSMTPLPRGRRCGHRDRRKLERAGWRTTLEYTENHVRGRDGMLISIEPQWTAVAELAGDTSIVATVTSTTVDQAWVELRAATVLSSGRRER
jgi:hypothetical protein